MGNVRLEPQRLFSKVGQRLLNKGFHDIDYFTAIAQRLMVPLCTNDLCAVAPDCILNLSPDYLSAKLNRLVPIVKVGMRYFHNSNFAIFNVPDAVQAGGSFSRRR